MTITLISELILFLLCTAFLPFLCIGVIRKTKATIQGRIGPPIIQPIFEFVKLMRKSQTLSETTTWVFRANAAMGVSTILLVAFLVPWLSFKPSLGNFHADDLFLIAYLLALPRFMTILASLDSGSPFAAFGSSREAYLAMLTEPTVFLSLASLALLKHSTVLSSIFNLSVSCSIYDLPVWIAASSGIFLASIVDLSRMPIDDPTTHLELTMVHGAMLIENSGKNLGLVEYAHMLKMVVLYGLTSQCILHALSYSIRLTPLGAGVISIALILLLAVSTALVESLVVKLRWRANPDFVAYAFTASLFAVAAALIGGIYARHGI